MEAVAQELPELSARRHLKVLAVPLVLIFLSTCGLSLEFRGYFADRAGLTAIGQITSSSGDVKTRPSDRFRWFEASKGAKIYENDSIRTVTDSSAKLKLKGGTEIDVEPGSLVVLKKDRTGNLAADLKSGSAHFDGSQGESTLMVNGKKLDISKAAGRIQVADGVMTMNVTKGEVTARTKDGVKHFAEGEQLELAPDGKVKVRPIPATLLEPEPDQVFDATPQSPERTSVRFRWKPASGGLPLRLEVSTTPGFSGIVYTGEQARPSHALTLPAGKYYWRVRDRDGMTPPQGFEIRESIPLRLLDPPDGESVLPAGNPPQLIFSWTGQERFSRYVVELSRDRAFGRRPLSVQVLGGGQAAMPAPKAGRYFWRVRGIHAQGGGAELSDTRSVTVTAEQADAGPEGIYPRADQDIQLDGTAGAINFRWQSRSGDEDYLLELSNRRDFRNTLLRKKVSSAELDWTPDKTGIYYWRVSRVGSRGNTGKPGTALRFRITESSIELIEPRDRARFVYDQTPPRVRFRWEELSGDVKYQVLVSRGSEFRKIDFRRKSDTASAEATSLGEGMYFWKVQVLSRSGEVIRSSETQGFEVSKRAAIQSRLQSNQASKMDFATAVPKVAPAAPAVVPGGTATDRAPAAAAAGKVAAGKGAGISVPTVRAEPKFTVPAPGSIEIRVKETKESQAKKSKWGEMLDAPFGL